jgi:hypothetical protein
MEKHFRPGTFFCHLILIHLTQPHQNSTFSKWVRKLVLHPILENGYLGNRERDGWMTFR